MKESHASAAHDALRALKAFRQSHPLQALEVDGIRWEFLALGQGRETVLFLHGLVGDASMWWQQMAALEGQYRCIAVTYPPLGTLAQLRRGILAVLDAAGVDDVNVVGTSNGGYLAQYLAATDPERLRRLVLGNTFAPNDLIARKNRLLARVLPHLPESWAMGALRRKFRRQVYPASSHDPLTVAMLEEMLGGRMSRAQVVARFRCIVETFDVPAPAMPVMILEADNVPLVEPALREQLKEAYPQPQVHKLGNVGHYPYLTVAGSYTRLVQAFLRDCPPICR